MKFSLQACSLCLCGVVMQSPIIVLKVFAILKNWILLLIIIVASSIMLHIRWQITLQLVFFNLLSRNKELFLVFDTQWVSGQPLFCHATRTNKIPPLLFLQFRQSCNRCNVETIKNVLPFLQIVQIVLLYPHSCLFLSMYCIRCVTCHGHIKKW